MINSIAWIEAITGVFTGLAGLSLIVYMIIDSLKRRKKRKDVLRRKGN